MDKEIKKPKNTTPEIVTDVYRESKDKSDQVNHSSSVDDVYKWAFVNLPIIALIVFWEVIWILGGC